MRYIVTGLVFLVISVIAHLRSKRANSLPIVEPPSANRLVDATHPDASKAHALLSATTGLGTGALAIILEEVMSDFPWLPPLLGFVALSSLAYSGLHFLMIWARKPKPASNLTILGAAMFAGLIAALGLHMIITSRQPALASQDNAILSVLSETLEDFKQDVFASEQLRLPPPIGLPPPEVSFDIPGHGNEVSIVVTNGSPYEVKTWATGKIVSSTDGFLAIGQPYYIKWQGSYDKLEYIPSNGVGILNVVAFGLDEVFRVPIFGLPWGTDLCLNFLMSVNQSPYGKSYFPLGCNSVYGYDFEDTEREIAVLLEVTVNAQSTIDPMLSTTFTARYLVRPDSGRTPIVMERIEYTP